MIVVIDALENCWRGTLLTGGVVFPLPNQQQHQSIEASKLKVAERVTSYAVINGAFVSSKISAVTSVRVVMKLFLIMDWME